MRTSSQRFTTSGPLDSLEVDADSGVVSGGTVLVCYKGTSTYTVMTFTPDSTSVPTKTLTSGLDAAEAATAFFYWQALQP